MFGAFAILASLALAAAPPPPAWACPPSCEIGPGTCLDAEADSEVLLQTQVETFAAEAVGHTPSFAHPRIAPLEVEDEILHVHPVWVLNLVVIVVFVGLVLFTAAGAWAASSKWSLAMFAASYVILIPGLFSKDFSFNIAVNLDLDALGISKGMQAILKGLMKDIPTHIQITQPRGVYGPIHESTRPLIGLLQQSHCHAGAVLIAFFAFGIPALKVVLLALGVWLSGRKSAACTTASKWTLFAVQVVSKWAAPDMFAIILLMHLILEMNHPPLIEALAVLDLGFTFYSVFCVFSVISSLAMNHGKSNDPQVAGAAPTNSAIVRLLGFGGVQGIILILWVAWLAFFVVGILTPVMSMSLQEVKIIENFHVPPAIMQFVQPLLKKINIEQLLSNDVSVWACSWSLLGHFFLTGRLNLLLACLMLVIFVMAITVMDMIALALAAYHLRTGIGKGVNLMRVPQVLRHLSFMDVLVVGVVTVTKVAGIYQEQGIIVHLRYGIWFLAASEVSHWVAFILLKITFDK